MADRYAYGILPASGNPGVCWARWCFELWSSRCLGWELGVCSVCCVILKQSADAAADATSYQHNKERNILLIVG